MSNKITAIQFNDGMVCVGKLKNDEMTNVYLMEPDSRYGQTDLIFGLINGITEPLKEEYSRLLKNGSLAPGPIKMARMNEAIGTYEIILD